MSDGLENIRAENLARSELYFRSAMRRSSHKRWQRAREWTGDWRNPVPPGAVASIWREYADAWVYVRHPDRHDWKQVRAYRLEHGVPYPDATPALVGWRPIETARQDGTRILLYDRFKRDTDFARFVGAWSDECGGYWHTIPGAYRVNPTHWAPLLEIPDR